MKCLVTFHVGKYGIHGHENNSDSFFGQNEEIHQHDRYRPTQDNEENTITLKTNRKKK